MRQEFVDTLVELTEPLEVTEEIECTDEECTHENCSQDIETGKWYKTIKLEPDEDELALALMAMQLKELTSIRKVLVFFTVLAVLGIISGVIGWIISIS